MLRIDSAICLCGGCATAGSSSQPAARAILISEDKDFASVFRMIAARWLSTVRWLIRKSAAMFLLGCAGQNELKDLTLASREALDFRHCGLLA